MKKSLVSALTTALVVGAASTTFAAANPFEDVAADHWAYDAVAQLAADGVIEGYGDGTYRGDQEITRYEMAQMVARAMAKSGVSAADKAMIDKLAAEFADELNALGVRVAALEKKVDNVKWNGTVRYRYINSRKEHDGDNNAKNHNNTNQVILRLEPSMTINNHWTGHARIDYGTDDEKDNMDTAKNNTTVQVERVWVEGQYGNTTINLGKLPMYSMVDDGMIFDDNIAGGQVIFGKNIKAAVSVGRARLEDVDVDGNGTDDSITASYQS
ncbi:MAG: S-layer homology domain-containing protein, partial [Schwartzia sp.]|nr:S-layer homology domain-containing protein [Schwartzia sp. (in: firmicutes)]